MEPLEVQTDLQEYQGREQAAHHLLGDGETKSGRYKLQNLDRGTI